MNIRPLLVVPTFDNPLTIAEVVSDLLSASELPVLVVDDGSRRPVADLLPRSARVTLTRHEQNRGKGQALKTAFAWALQHGYTHVLTVDGDGQHPSSQVGALIAAALERPWSLVVGVRRFPALNVPGASRFGREFSNFWIRYETGTPVRDSQSGMRVYPLFFVQGLRLLTVRYDFEVEIMTRLLWAGVELVEVDVDVLYPPVEQRVSHFHKVRDNVRITLLNIWLVTLSLFTRPRPAWVLAASLAVAVLLGLQPGARGLWVTALVVLTVLGRLSAAVAVPAFACAALAVPPLQERGIAVHGEARPLAAALTVAVALAAVACLQGLAAWRRRRRQVLAAASPWSGRNRGGTIGPALLRWVGRSLGLGATYVCLAFIAPYFYLFAPRAKRSSLEFMVAARPDRRWLGRHLAVVAHFYTFGMVLLDRLFAGMKDMQAAGGDRSTPFLALDVHNKQVFDEQMACGHGLVLVTAHAGGWDIATRLLVGDKAKEQRKAAVVAAIDAGGPRIYADSDAGHRRSRHNEPVPMLAYKETLDAKGLVCMMVDRPLSERLALVPFLGKLAAFDLTPFRLALATGVPVLYTFAFRTGYRRYAVTMTLAPALTAGPGADRDQVCENGVRHFVQELERHLRQHPYQWFNFYPFFSSRPAVPS